MTQMTKHSFGGEDASQQATGAPTEHDIRLISMKAKELIDAYRHRNKSSAISPAVIAAAYASSSSATQPPPAVPTNPSGPSTEVNYTYPLHLVRVLICI